jgi:hypothetical protein
MKAAFIEVTRFLLILLFIYTASSKIQTFHTFQGVLIKSPLIGKHLALYVAILIPAIEIVAAALLLFPKTTPKGFYVSTVLMGLFTFYVTYMVLFAPKLPCVCGGIIKEMTWKQHIVFNTIIFLLSGICSLRYNDFINKQTGLSTTQPV